MLRVPLSFDETTTRAPEFPNDAVQSERSASPRSGTTGLVSALLESLVFGFANSLHCAGMCGPLAACVVSTRCDVAAYQASRLLAYVLAGLGLGAAGAALGGPSDSGTGHAWVSFVLAAALILGAFGGERFIGSIPGLKRLLGGVLRRSRQLPAAGRAAALGGATALLPCGLLYAIYAGAAVAGGALSGGSVMLGFAVGSAPILIVAQLHVGWLQKKLGPSGLARIRLAAMLSAAGLLIWRGWQHLNGSSCCPP